MRCLLCELYCRCGEEARIVDAGDQLDGDEPGQPDPLVVEPPRQPLPSRHTPGLGSV